MNTKRNSKTRRYIYLPILLAVLMLAGCTLPLSQISTLVPTPGSTGSAPGMHPLANTAWQLTALGDADAATPVVPGSTVTLAFEDGTAGGNGGCNSYGGDYTVQGDTIQFGELFATRMACVDSSVMEQEQQYLEALRSADSFAIAEDQLTISYDAGSSSLIFSAAATTPTPAPAQEAEVAVTLERGVCFGTCPAYMVTIYSDGTVVFEGERFVAAEGTQTTTIEPEVVEQLVAGFEAAGYFEWEDEYTEMTVSDLPTITTSVRRDGETKQITRYAGDSSAPLALPYLETWIDFAAHTSQWTGASTSLANVPFMDTPVMTLERTACFGMCPVYGLAVFADGTVVYIGLRHVAETGVHITSVDPGEVESLAVQTAALGYFEWDDEYTVQVVTDHPYAITTLSWEDQYKQITRYDGDPNAPVGLVRFEDSIDRLANVAQWVEAAE